MNRWSIAGVLIVAAFAAGAWLVEDSFLLFVLGVLPLILIGLPVSFFAVLYLLNCLRVGRSLDLSLNILSVVAALGGMVGGALLGSEVTLHFAIGAAKEYPAQVALALETYRRLHSAYPDRLDQLPSVPPFPRLLRESGSYRSEGQSYSFSFSVPSGLYGHRWDFDSATGTWNFFD